MWSDEHVVGFRWQNTSCTKERDTGLNWVKTARAKGGSRWMLEEGEICLLKSTILSRKNLRKISQVSVEGWVIIMPVVLMIAFIMLKRTLGLWQLLDISSEEYFNHAGLTVFWNWVRKFWSIAWVIWSLTIFRFFVGLPADLHLACSILKGATESRIFAEWN